MGERSVTYAAARSLIIQACTLHGPADLDIVVLTTAADAERWEWIKWLPHSHPAGEVQIVHGADAVEAWSDAQRTLSTVITSMMSTRHPDATSITLAIIDDAELWRGRTAPRWGDDHRLAEVSRVVDTRRIGAVAVWVTLLHVLPLSRPGGP